MSQKRRWSVLVWLLISILTLSTFHPSVFAEESDDPIEIVSQEETAEQQEEEPASEGSGSEEANVSTETEPENAEEPTEPEEPYTGWKDLEEGRQYWDNGTAVTGMQTIDKNVYLFDDAGFMLTGLQDYQAHMYYFGADGVRQTGWQTIDGKKYYFDTLTAVAATGITKIDGKKYAFNEAGVQQTGWQTIDGIVYYFNPSTGQIATGITTISGKKYLLDASTGARLTGKHTIDGNTYYASKKGVLYTGEHKIGKYYYYFFKKNNAMAKGKFVDLKDADGNKYRVYYNKSGHKVFGDQKIGSYYYRFNNTTGAMTRSKFVKLKDKNGKTYKVYYDGKGRKAFGEKTIKGHVYYFNKKTGKLEWKDRKYQNPKGYYQIQSTDIKLKGGDYSLDIGSEGLKVRAVLKYLGISNGVGMYGSLYTSYVKERVKDFQRAHGLKVDGIVGIYTWKAMGFTKKQWLSLGGYASPNQGSIYNTKKELIEIMIDRAYDYLGDDYVIGASGAPGKGIDCSGLVMQALFAVGIDMTPINPVRHAHVDYEYESANIWKSPYLKHVSYSDRKRGDIVIYQNAYGTVIHSAIYLGNDMVIESWPNRVMVSHITASFHSNVKGILRVFN